ncbi:MAG TPA: hypothetical protein VNA11_21155 [Pseudonocardia sp.]|nr:hypothetical protein [Pseudonocardia sp.]
MKGGAILLAILLGIFLAVGQCGSGSADENGDSSSSSSDDHDDSAASDHDSSDDDSDDDSDDKDSDKDSAEESNKDSDKDSGETDHTEAMKQHLESQGIQVEQVVRSTDDDCAAHSYGEVRDHFADHPCQSLERAWYELGDGQGDSAVMSVAWVEMPDAEDTADLQQLVDRPGTGNITELSKEDGPYQDVTYSGWYYRSGRDGSTFHSVQAEPLADNQGSRELARRASGATAAD